ncbi:hypothetical protein [Dyadobacter frigoris]|uniref:Uncharacterized protein n=1 Tax=Dyadobacter frigoris TaxID=2576211 RepID=A0A4V6BKQ4_9BACT|nr:hypothetical protein [Dyadobacter frigoris]TKT91823.1 hypothetical protein FDK13_11745 [Dyadobacter frigoris]
MHKSIFQYTRLPIYAMESLINTRAGRWKFSFFLFLFVLLTTYPKYIEILNEGSPLNTYAFFFEKIEHPLSPSISNDIESHGSKIAFRFTPSLIAKLLGNYKVKNGKGILQLFVFQSLLLLPFFYLLIKTVKRFSSNFNTVLIALSFSAIYTTKAFFWDYDFWFDGYAYFFLLLGMYFRNMAGIFLSLQLACWTDERAAVALASIFMFHLLEENNFSLPAVGSLLKFSLKKSSIAVLLSGLTYIATRILLSVFLELSTPMGDKAGVGLELIPFQIANRLIGILLSFEGLWLVFLTALSFLFAEKKFFLAAILILLTCAHILIAYSVFDITRSLAYCFPIFIISAALVQTSKSDNSDFIFLLSALGCILVPTQFLIFFVRQIPWTIFSVTEITQGVKNMLLLLGIN